MINNKGARWMVVDNDKETLDTLARLLAAVTNAEVHAFHSAPDALDAFVTAPESYELVVTDFEMPRMNGVDLRRNLHTVEPALKVFMITGGGKFTEECALRSGFCGLLRKPFTLHALRYALEVAHRCPITRTALSASI